MHLSVSFLTNLSRFEGLAEDIVAPGEELVRSGRINGVTD